MNSHDTNIPRPEYPRPQFVRTDWLNLNGVWEFAFDDIDQGIAVGWPLGLPLDRQIITPFPYQSELSGINDKSVHEIIWYARDFEVPSNWNGMNVLLHFGAVDYECTVWVNSQEVGHNRGGHTPFQFNVGPYLNVGKNRLTVRVLDTQNPAQPRGKQSVSGLPHDIDYYCTSGIWQTVWLEPVPPIRIDSLKISAAREHETLELTVYLHAPSAIWHIEADVFDGDALVAQTQKEICSATVSLRLKIPNAKLWSPEFPHLYQLRVRLFQGDHLLDEVGSYAGLRQIELRDGYCLINGEKTYLRMVLDQGYWPESYLAAPSDAALREDVEWVKKFGFNGVRKHQKIEDPRWLYWCDRLGLLVWGEMPNAREWSTQAEERLAAEWKRAVERDYNHPSVITWVPINESMGLPGLKESHPAQYAFVERMVGITRQADAYRPVIDNDGWEHSDITDICAIHDYTATATLLKERYHETRQGGPLPPHVWIDNKPLFVLGSRYRGQPVVLSEVGGFLQIPRDVPAQNRDMLFDFYGSCQSNDELLVKYRDLMEGIAALPFVAGFCYTQLTDIEQETNGLLTYYRQPKVAPQEIARIHKRLFGFQSGLTSDNCVVVDEPGVPLGRTSRG
jgi:beta-galactosidase/beta-glucuronidase